MNIDECPTDALLTKFGSYYEMSMDVKYDPIVESVTVPDDSVVHIIGGKDLTKYPDATATTMERGLRELFAYVGDRGKHNHHNVLPKALKKPKKPKKKAKKAKNKRKSKAGGDDSDSSLSSGGGVSDVEDIEIPDNIVEDIPSDNEDVEEVPSEFKLDEFVDHEPQHESQQEPQHELQQGGFNLSEFAADETN